jgi:serine/threonine protein kinase
MGRTSSRTWIRGNVIGEGTFGQVSVALDARTGEIFAVKSVDFEEGNLRSHTELAALENEIKMLQHATSSSEFVVKSFGDDWTSEGGRRRRNLWLEYMAGGSLADVLEKHGGGAGLNEHLLHLVTAKVLKGLQHLHNHGICHCDVKCKNILVGLGGAVKLADFGSAKLVAPVAKEADSATGTGSLVRRDLRGTPMWMAPEVVRQESQGPPSDIWSLGCTVLEMATGRAPWNNVENLCQIMYRIGCTTDVPIVLSFLSVDVHDFLGHCFQRDPQKRWTASQLLQHPFIIGKRCLECYTI